MTYKGVFDRAFDGVSARATHKTPAVRRQTGIRGRARARMLEDRERLGYLMRHCLGANSTMRKVLVAWHFGHSTATTGAMG